MTLDVRHEIINVPIRIDAEEYFIDKFKKEGYECYKSRGEHIVYSNIDNYALIDFLKKETRNGIPDLVAFNSKKFFFIEVKSEDDTLRKSRLNWIKNHPNVEVIVYYLKQKISKEPLLIDDVTRENFRDKLFHEISKKNDIRAVKPEYRIILDVLQTISPTTKQELLEEINSGYAHEIFTYKQLWDNVNSLVGLGVIKDNILTKQISINPEYISYPESLPISSYCIYIFAISAIFFIISILTQFMLVTSLAVFVVGILYLTAQHFGSKFVFRK